MKPRKRKRLLLAVAAGVFAFALWFFILRNTEPTYHGKRLSEWVDIVSPRRSTTYTAAQRAEATVAIRAIGTNGLPNLVAWVSHAPKGLRLKVLRSYRRFPAWLQNNQTFFRFVYKPHIRADGAVEAFADLGHSAAAAIPDLTRLARSTNDSPTRSRALSALAYIGPDALPTIVGVVSNLSQPADLWITQPLTRLKRSEFDQILPALLPHLQSTNLPLALQVSNFLRDMSSDSELIVPAYIKCLSDPRWEIRADAAGTLGPMGWSRAHAGVPALVKALGDTNATVRSNAVAAIRMINPGALPEELRAPASPP